MAAPNYSQWGWTLNPQQKTAFTSPTAGGFQASKPGGGLPSAGEIGNVDWASLATGLKASTPLGPMAPQLPIGQGTDAQTIGATTNRPRSPVRSRTGAMGAATPQQAQTMADTQIPAGWARNPYTGAMYQTQTPGYRGTQHNLGAGRFTGEGEQNFFDPSTGWARWVPRHTDQLWVPDPSGVGFRSVGHVGAASAYVNELGMNQATPPAWITGGLEGLEEARAITGYSPEGFRGTLPLNLRGQQIPASQVPIGGGPLAGGSVIGQGTAPYFSPSSAAVTAFGANAGSNFTDPSYNAFVNAFGGGGGGGVAGITGGGGMPMQQSTPLMQTNNPGTTGGGGGYSSFSSPDNYLAGLTGGTGYAENIARNAGFATNATPAWEAMVDAQERNNQRRFADLQESFNVMGGRFSSDFGSAATDFQSQVAADQNSLLGQMTLAAQESARQRELQAAMGLGQWGYGAGSQLSSQDFQANMQQQQFMMAAAMAQFQAQQQAAQALAGFGAQGAQGLFGAENQAAMSEVARQMQLQGYSLDAANMMANMYMQNLGLGGQLGMGQFGIQQYMQQMAMQEWLRTQPQYNPLLQYMYGGATAYPPIFSPQYMPGFWSQLGQFAGQLPWEALLGGG